MSLNIHYKTFYLEYSSLDCIIKWINSWNITVLYHTLQGALIFSPEYDFAVLNPPVKSLFEVSLYCTMEGGSPKSPLPAVMEQQQHSHLWAHGGAAGEPVVPWSPTETAVPRTGGEPVIARRPRNSPRSQSSDSAGAVTRRRLVLRKVQRSWPSVKR